MYSAFAIRNRGAQGQHIVFHGNPHRAWDRSMQAQRLTHEHIEVRESVELVHCWIVCVDGEEFIPKFVLNPEVLR